MYEVYLFDLAHSNEPVKTFKSEEEARRYARYLITTSASYNLYGVRPDYRVRKATK